MDVLDILIKSGRDLYPDELDFFETELDTGDYEQEYIDKCKEQIKKIRNWQNPEAPKSVKAANSTDIQKDDLSSVVKSLADIAPAINNPLTETLTKEQLILNDIEAIRKENSYKNKFKEYVFKNDDIDEQFMDNKYAFFEPWEMDAFISVKPVSEWFLEKYFASLDHDKIARFQYFSEEFYMKHFSEFEAGTVLKFGKNEWKKKSKRSKKLDVFLRLKGVNI